MSVWLNNVEITNPNAEKPCHKLGWCPYGQLVEEFPIKEDRDEKSCDVFGHDCPVFYHREETSEKSESEVRMKILQEIIQTKKVKADTVADLIENWI